jgi:hypothetical protein
MTECTVPSGEYTVPCDLLTLAQDNGYIVHEDLAVEFVGLPSKVGEPIVNVADSAVQLLFAMLNLLPDLFRWNLFS